MMIMNSISNDILNNIIIDDNIKINILKYMKYKYNNIIKQRNNDMKIVSIISIDDREKDDDISSIIFNITTNNNYETNNFDEDTSNHSEIYDNDYDDKVVLLNTESSLLNNNDVIDDKYEDNNNYDTFLMLKQSMIELKENCDDFTSTFTVKELEYLKTVFTIISREKINKIMRSNGGYNNGELSINEVINGINIINNNIQLIPVNDITKSIIVDIIIKNDDDNNGSYRVIEFVRICKEIKDTLFYHSTELMNICIDKFSKYCNNNSIIVGYDNINKLLKDIIRILYNNDYYYMEYNISTVDDICYNATTTTRTRTRRRTYNDNNMIVDDDDNTNIYNFKDFIEILKVVKNDIDEMAIKYIIYNIDNSNDRDNNYLKLKEVNEIKKIFNNKCVDNNNNNNNKLNRSETKKILEQFNINISDKHIDLILNNISLEEVNHNNNDNNNDNYYIDELSFIKLLKVIIIYDNANSNNIRYEDIHDN